MSELIGKDATRGNFRKYLFVSTSALVLMATAVWPNCAGAASDTEKPTVWIELGGQLERIEGTGNSFIAPFMALSPVPAPYLAASPIEAQRSPRYSIGEEGKLTFQPAGTDWVFSAAVRYGRSNGNKLVKHQTNITGPHGALGPSCYLSTCVPSMITEKGAAARLAKTFAKHNESHAVLDFMAGKDVGLGLFHGGNAVISAGVRYAQFYSRSDAKVYARPDVEFYNLFTTGTFAFNLTRFNNYTMLADSRRSFRGIGPAVKLEASTSVAGDPSSMTFAIDWGLNASVLFGRQKAVTHHETMASGYRPKYHVGQGGQKYDPLYPTRVKDSARSRSVIVPNIGAFAAVSLKFPNAKISLGYRGDFFFGATDVGIDARKEDRLSFYGPFATISIGLGR